MKYILIALLALTTISCGKNQTAAVGAEIAASQDTHSHEEGETDQHVLTPEQEDEYYSTFFPGQSKSTARGFKFSQTTWQECRDEITGNYFGYNCSNNRAISTILKSFMDKHIYKCIDKGLAAQGGGKVDELHVVHAGIFGDPRHSPKSLHAENRAIDVKSFEVKLTNGQVKKFVFSGTTHRSFFKAFRTCWGEVVRANNGCPAYNGNIMYTGSIGWEDKNHQHHMHTSVPYCVGGSYGAYYYRR